MSEQVITIEEYNNPHRADMARMCLEAEDIPVFLENRFIVETDWLLANAVGNIRLQVPVTCEKRAREILATLAPPQSALGDRKEIDAALTCLNCGQPMSEEDVACSACGWSYEASEIEASEIEASETGNAETPAEADDSESDEQA